MCVDPRGRGVRIGQRLYDARKTLAERLELKGIIIGGRMPGYHRNRRKVDGPEGYLEAVTTGKLRDPVRSEEHKSELQSLMRISYAVFCLKKKQKRNVTTPITNENINQQ